MIILGLTGSIAMGKSTVTAMFADEGIPTTNADAIVHRLLQSDNSVQQQIRTHFPDAWQGGEIDRKKLGEGVFGNPQAVKLLESILHPRVRAEELAFILSEQQKGSWLVVLDIPLLYETGADARMDKVAVVTAAPDIQRERALSRPGMTEEKFRHILSRQMPDAEKRARADFVIETDKGLEFSRMKVLSILASLKKQETSHA